MVFTVCNVEFVLTDNVHIQVSERFLIMVYDNNDGPVYSVLNGKGSCGFFEQFCDRFSTGDEEDPWLYSWQEGYSDPSHSYCDCPNGTYNDYDTVMTVPCNAANYTLVLVWYYYCNP